MANDTDSDWRHLLTEGERARMLDDIARVSLAVGRQLSPERTWDDLDVAARSLAERRSPVERLAFIARLLPDLTRAVHQLQELPLTQAAQGARTVSPAHRARRVGAAALLAAVRRGHAERSLTEHTTVWTPDTPENRAVRAFMSALRRDAAVLGNIASAAGEAETTQVAQDSVRRLRGLEALPLWDGVTGDDGAWRAPPTHRMLADTRYAPVAEAMRRYRQSFQFDWAHPLFSLPARESWRLYEVWGLFQTLEAVTALGYTPAQEPPTAGNGLFAVHQDRLTFSVVKGTESRVRLRAPGGRALSLFYNRAYPQRTRSLSRTMQPDVALEREDGLTWALDPKFKAYAAPGSEGDDMDQMHAYRDAIIDSQGVRTVARAWCLFCGAADGEARPLIAYGPPAASPVGALRLRPGDPEGITRLCRLLAVWGL